MVSFNTEMTEFSKLFMLAYCHMKIWILLQQFEWSIFEWVIALFHYFIKNFVHSTPPTSYMRTPQNFECLFIAIWRFSYHCTSMLGSYLEELLPLFT
jgi:hypothetical protein